MRRPRGEGASFLKRRVFGLPTPAKGSVLELAAIIESSEGAMSVLRTIGKINALTAITKIKLGHAPDLRRTLEGLTAAGGGKIS
jgi:hypothetical protein